MNAEKWRSCIQKLRNHIGESLDSAAQCYLDLGGRKIVRILACDPLALRLINRELPWVVVPSVPPGREVDGTVILWKEEDVNGFASKVFGLEPTEENIASGFEPFLYEDRIVSTSESERLVYVKIVPTGQVNLADQTIHIADGDTYYYGTTSYEPKDWIKEGHIFVQMLYRILEKDDSASIVHGACLGLDGNGVLICARGQGGKSTLTITSMLDGFEYVSEDYLVLEKASDGLFASPLYSIISLSPEMYDRLYDKMDKAHFVGISHFKGKYVFDMSDYGDALRYRYPVKACLFPEITPDAAEPSIVAMDAAGKGKAMTQMIHSTLYQMWSKGLQQRQKDSDFVRKVISMVSSMPFYKIILTPDIFANTRCLREFVQSL